VVRVTVAIPPERAAGGYWCVLTVDELPDPLAPTVGVGVRFVASVSTGIFIYLDPVKRNAEILDLQTLNNDILVKVRNLGNAPLGVEGRIEFYSGAAQTPAAVTTLSRSTVLTEPSPDGTITAELPPAAALPAGHYRVRAILDFGGDHYIGAERDIDLARGDREPVHGPQR